MAMTSLKFKSPYELLLLLATILSVGLTSCDPEEEMLVPEFNRTDMLRDLADKLIIPNFEAFDASIDNLRSLSEVFINAPSTSNLLVVREAWVEVAKNHQHCSAFGFGPADLSLGSYAQVLAAFPIDETQLEANIQNPSFDLANSFDTDVRGIYGLEYLLYRSGLSDQEVVDSFDAERIAYYQLILDELNERIADIHTEWTNSYRSSFTSDNGTSAGSSTSNLYNDFVLDYENLKNFKVELPAGLTAGQQGPDGSLVEALYSGISTTLIEEHFASSKNIWYGRSRSGSNFIGFEEYLQEVTGGFQLIDETKAAIGQINEAISSLPVGPLSENVGDSSVEQLRNELQANTANFKSSMSSLLGISITFNSGDGD